jgi:long-chain acyl-CoA synthetase
MVAGGTLILVPGLRFPALVFKALATHRATGLSCVPSGLAVLIRSSGEGLGERAGNLRYMEMGSERMDAAAKRELMKLLPATRICMHYGLTEASRSAFTEFHRDAARLESVGKASPNVSIEIFDEAGSPLPAGESGRIRVRAATVMKSYWRDPERTRTVLDQQGWFDTGDLGYLDADGYLFLQGRGDDVINVGGRKVYPAAIEDLALRYAGVAEAACVAAPDPEGLVAEVPVLYIVAADQAAPDPAGLLRFLEAGIERYAVPRQVRCVEALPKTASGKIQRSVLRAQAQGGGGTPRPPPEPSSAA